MSRWFTVFYHEGDWEIDGSQSAFIWEPLDGPNQPERRFPPRGLRPPVERRPMTDDEAQMARAVASCPLISRSLHKAAIRNLHARSLSVDRYVTAPEADLLRACVLEFRGAIGAVDRRDRRAPPSRVPHPRPARRAITQAFA